MITAALAAILIVLFAYLGTFRHQDGGICVGPNPVTGSCRSFSHPTPPLGPGGEAVTDTYYFVHRTLTGDGTITVRVGSLSGRIQGGNGNSASVADMVGTPGPVQPWAKAGLILTASSKPGSPYAAVMLTGGHGVRMQSDYTHDIAGSAASAHSPRWLRLTRSGTTLTGFESADGRTWTRIGSADLRGLPQAVQAGLFVTSPETAPPAQAFVPGVEGQGHRCHRNVRASLIVTGRMVGPGGCGRRGHRQQRRRLHDHELGRLPAIRLRLHGRRVRRHRAFGRRWRHRQERAHRRVRRPDRADRARCDVHHRRVPPRADPHHARPRAPAGARC